MNKKAQSMTGLLILMLIILVIVVGGFFIAVGTGILTFVSSQVNSVTTDLGVVGDTNMSWASDVTVGTINTTIQMLKWGSAILMIFGLLGVLILAGTIRYSPNGFLIGLFIILVILLVIVSIYMTNLYKQFYNGTDEIATELKTMSMTSFLLLHMPHIITIISFIGGIIIFSGIGEEII